MCYVYYVIVYYVYYIISKLDYHLSQLQRQLNESLPPPDISLRCCPPKINKIKINIYNHLPPGSDLCYVIRIYIRRINRSAEAQTISHV